MRAPLKKSEFTRLWMSSSAHNPLTFWFRVDRIGFWFFWFLGIRCHMVRVASLAVLIALTLVGVSSMTFAQVDPDLEWRQWGGPRRDFMTVGTDLADSWPESGPPELWSRPLGAGHSAILVSEGRLFTMYRVSHGQGGGRPWTPRETVIAMDAATDETIWEHTYASENQDFGQGAGPHATPLIAGDRLFTVGTNKEVHVFNPATGALLWSKNLVTDFGAPPLLIRSMVKPGYGVNPLAYKDTIIMQVGGPGQSVMALRQSDGEVVWKSGSFLVSHAPSGLISVDGRPHLVTIGDYFTGNIINGGQFSKVHIGVTQVGDIIAVGHASSTTAHNA